MLEREEATSRSYEDLKVGQQVYAVIENCTDPAVLYAKIESGHWDWLGVQRRKNQNVFWLGRPRRARSTVVSGLSKHSGKRRHWVSIQTPHHIKTTPTEAWWPTPAEARADFERQKVVLSKGDGSGLYKVRLYIDGELAQEEFVVRALHNRL